MPGSTPDLITTLQDIKSTLVDVNTTLVKFSSAAGSAGSAGMDLIDIIMKGSAGYDEYKTAVDKARESLREIQKFHFKEIKALRENVTYAAAQRSLKKQERALENNLNVLIERQTKSYTTLGETLRKVSSVMKTSLGALGATAFSFQDGKEKLLAYNQAMFNFSRTQKVMGKNAGDIKKAFQIVGDSTTLSRSKFASFINVAASGWKGIMPTSQALADLARNLQSAFGPSVEVTEQKLKSLLELQNKFPAMANTIKDAMDKIQKGKPFDENQRKNIIAQIALQRANGKISKEQANDYYQMITKTTKSQNDQVRSNKANANVAKRSEDMLLSMAEKIEPALTRVAESVEKIISYLEKVPGVVMTAGAAFALFNKTAFSGLMIPSPLNLLKGAGGPGGAGGVLSGVSKTVKLAPAAAAAAAPAATTATATAAAAAAAAKTATTATTATTAARTGMAGFGKFLSKAVKPAAIIGGIIEGVSTGIGEYKEKRKEGYDEKTAKGAAWRRGGVAGGGAMGGALAGAALGTAIAGPIGTVIGGVLGGIGGGNFGSKVGKQWSDGFAKEASKSSEKLVDEMQEQFDTIAQGAEKYAELLANFNFAVEANEKNTSLLKDQLSALQEMGQLKGVQDAKNLFAPLLMSLQNTKDELNSFIPSLFDKDALGGSYAQLLGNEFMGKLTDSLSGQQGNLREAVMTIVTSASQEIEKLGNKKIQIQAEIIQAKAKGESGKDEADAKEIELNALLSQQAGLRELISTAQEKSSKLTQVELDYVKNIRASYNSTAEQMNKLNSVVEQRLQVERELMEVAQFGMGASIEMMQKQVDMAYKLMKIEHERMAGADEAIKQQLIKAGLTKEESDTYADLIKGAESVMDAQSMINQIAGEGTDEAKALLGIYQDQQDASMKIMQQQKKIYDLTKDMREGYLDAIRAMSVGAGEFSKIIGTQEMGVTQLMDAVGSVGSDALKGTMKLGGQQSSEDTAAGLGTQITGKYSATGRMLSFLPGQGGPDSQEARNNRLYGWQDNKEKFDKMKSGESGEPSQVGTASGGEKYIDATREGVQSGAYDGVFNGMKAATIELSRKGGYGIGYGELSTDVLTPINKGLTDRRSYAPPESQNPAATVNWAARLARNAQPQTPAPGFFQPPGVTGSSANVPVRSVSSSAPQGQKGIESRENSELKIKKQIWAELSKSYTVKATKRKAIQEELLATNNPLEIEAVFAKHSGVLTFGSQSYDEREKTVDSIKDLVTTYQNNEADANSEWMSEFHKITNLNSEESAVFMNAQLNNLIQSSRLKKDQLDRLIPELYAAKTDRDVEEIARKHGAGRIEVPLKEFFGEYRENQDDLTGRLRSILEKMPLEDKQQKEIIAGFASGNSKRYQEAITTLQSIDPSYRDEEKINEAEKIGGSLSSQNQPKSQAWTEEQKKRVERAKAKMKEPLPDASFMGTAIKSVRDFRWTGKQKREDRRFVEELQTKHDTEVQEHKDQRESEQLFKDATRRSDMGIASPVHTGVRATNAQKLFLERIKKHNSQQNVEHKIKYTRERDYKRFSGMQSETEQAEEEKQQKNQQAYEAKKVEEERQAKVQEIKEQKNQALKKYEDRRIAMIKRGGKDKSGIGDTQWDFLFSGVQTDIRKQMGGDTSSKSIKEWQDGVLQDFRDNTIKKEAGYQAIEAHYAAEEQKVLNPKSPEVAEDPIAKEKELKEKLLKQYEDRRVAMVRKSGGKGLDEKDRFLFSGVKTDQREKLAERFNSYGRLGITRFEDDEEQKYHQLNQTDFKDLTKEKQDEFLKRQQDYVLDRYRNENVSDSKLSEDEGYIAFKKALDESKMGPDGTISQPVTPITPAQQIAQAKEARDNSIAQNIRDRIGEAPRHLKTDKEKQKWRLAEARKLLESEAAQVKMSQGPEGEEYVETEGWGDVDRLKAISENAASMEKSGRKLSPAELSKLTMEDMGKEGKKYYTSAAQERRPEASAAMQAEFASPEKQAQIEQMYGGAMQSEGGGGGSGTIVVELSPHLQATITNMQNMLIRIEQAGNSK